MPRTGNKKTPIQDQRALDLANASLEKVESVPRDEILNNLDIVNEHISMFITDIDSRISFLRAGNSPDLEAPKNPRRILLPMNHKEYRSTSHEPNFIYQPVFNHFLSKVIPSSQTPDPKRNLSLDKSRAEIIRNRNQSRTSSREHIFQKQPVKNRLKLRPRILESFKESQRDSRLTPIQDTMHKFAVKQDIFNAYHNGDKASYSGDPESDPTVKYSTTCIKQKVPPLPILSYIQGNELVLNMYSLPNEYCIAFGRSAINLYDLQHIYLDENNITDEGGSEILKGLASQRMIRTLYYTRNEIGLKFAKQFENLVMSSKQLIDLNFRGCKYNSHAMCNLLDHIGKIPQVRKCILSDLSLTDSLVDKLCRTFTYKKILELDLSYNSISYYGSCIFWSSFKKLKYTRYLDYSWNNLTSPKLELSNMIYSTILTHRRIMHINLSYTKLNQYDVDIIIKATKESGTLIGLHLCGNKINEQISENLINTLGANKYDAYYTNSAFVIPYPLKTTSNKQTLPKLTPRDKYEILAVTSRTRIPNLKVKDEYGKQVATHRDNPINKFKASKCMDFQFFDDSKPQIFTRYLGSGSEEIPDATLWKHSAKCWICEKWEPYHLVITIPNLLKQLDVSCCLNRNEETGKVILKASFNNWQEIEMKESEEKDDQYELFALLPPGKHFFWIIYDNFLCIDKKITSSFWVQSRVNELNLQTRLEEISVSRVQKSNPIRSFDKNSSVFKHFLDNTDEVKKVMLENDLKYAKLNRMIKDENDVTEVTRVLFENYTEIKEIFDFYASESMYFTIGMLDFSNFCEKCNILDGKHMNIAAIDRIFIAANYEVTDLADNPDNSLCRYEFFEVLVRLAMYKFQDETATALEKFNKLLNEYILPNALGSNASAFRKEKMYNIEVNQLLEVNLSGLQTLFTKYRDKTAKSLKIDGIKQFLASCSLALEEKDLRKLFAFSKMSVLDEMDGKNQNEKMQFVEFLEFLGRVAELVHKDYVELEVKLKRLLEVVFKKAGIKLKEPKIEERAQLTDGED